MLGWRSDVFYFCVDVVYVMLGEVVKQLYHRLYTFCVREKIPNVLGSALVFQFYVVQSIEGFQKVDCHRFLTR